MGQAADGRTGVVARAFREEIGPDAVTKVSRNRRHELRYRISCRYCLSDEHLSRWLRDDPGLDRRLLRRVQTVYDDRAEAVARWREHEKSGEHQTNRTVYPID